MTLRLQNTHTRANTPHTSTYAHDSYTHTHTVYKQTSGWRSTTNTTNMLLKDGAKTVSAERPVKALLVIKILMNLLLCQHCGGHESSQQYILLYHVYSYLSTEVLKGPSTVFSFMFSFSIYYLTSQRTILQQQQKKGDFLNVFSTTPWIHWFSFVSIHCEIYYNHTEGTKDETTSASS